MLDTDKAHDFRKHPSRTCCTQNKTNNRANGKELQGVKVDPSLQTVRQYGGKFTKLNWSMIGRFLLQMEKNQSITWRAANGNILPPRQVEGDNST